MWRKRGPNIDEHGGTEADTTAILDTELPWDGVHRRSSSSTCIYEDAYSSDDDMIDTPPSSPTDGDDSHRPIRRQSSWSAPRLKALMPSATMGVFRGSFVPACIGLVGPTLFLRLPYVLSQAGLWVTLLIILTIGVVGFFTVSGASDSHLDLIRAPYVLYGVKYIDLVSLAPLKFLILIFIKIQANAILTSGRIDRPGGAYLIISRTLGAELGASIGVLIVADHLIVRHLSAPAIRSFQPHSLLLWGSFRSQVCSSIQTS